MNYYLEVSLFLTSEIGRVLATAVVPLMGWAVVKLLAKSLSSSEEGRTKTREKLVFITNLVKMVVVATIFAIWASKIAGVALSLVAVAGALLIVNKELILCLAGSLLLSSSRLYRIGNFIEIGTYKGLVIDLDFFYTTLAETGNTNQLTGKTVSVPNSLLLTQAIKNTSATGEYIIDLFEIIVPFNIDIEFASLCGVSAATLVCKDWLEAADAHFTHIENKAFLDLPSSRPKILWESINEKSMKLIIRFACLINERVNSEQKIFREFWKMYKEKYSPMDSTVSQ